MGINPFLRPFDAKDGHVTRYICSGTSSCRQISNMRRETWSVIRKKASDRGHDASVAVVVGENLRGWKPCCRFRGGL